MLHEKYQNAIQKSTKVQSEKHKKCDAQNRNEAAKLNLPASWGCIGGMSAHLLEALFHI